VKAPSGLQIIMPKYNGIDIANSIAHERGGLCLSENYTDYKTKMLWECDKKHRWNANLAQVKTFKKWCPKCAKISGASSRKLDGIKEANQIALEKNGKCLSSEYINIDSKLDWECQHGHIWKASLYGIKSQKTWCPVCAGILKLDGLNVARKLATDHGGVCMSADYINNKTNMIWKCGRGHVWEATLNAVKTANHWCRKCYELDTLPTQKKLKNGLEIAQQLAKAHSGECLSNEYKRSDKKLLWRCKNNHQWCASLSHVRFSNSWCPDCAQINGARVRNNRYTIKHWKTNKELVCQGSWEKLVVEYLNKNNINFRWQPRSFTMPNGKKYYPDLYLFGIKTWIEIKGYFWGESEKKWNWFSSTKTNSELWNKDKLKKLGIL